MPKEIIIENARIVNSTDWKAKSEYIIEQLNETLFKGLTLEDSYNITYDKFGNEVRKKKQVKKGDVMPDISAAQVTTKLNRLLRVYRPMTTAQAMTMEDTEFLEAYGYYLDIISHVNNYVTFIGDKQMFSAFCNITTDTYNELLTDPKYSQVFASIEDGFVQSNFSVAQAGLVDGKITVAKLQAKDAGHSLVKSPESITIVNNTKVDKVLVNQQLDKFLGMTKQIGGKK